MSVAQYRPIDTGWEAYRCQNGRRYSPDIAKYWYDGDLVLLINNQLMTSGVHRDAPVVMDIEDKITALAEEDTPENRASLVLRTINSLIGETSNAATGYHNKLPKSEAVRRKYESYVDLLSVINGKAINA